MAKLRSRFRHWLKRLSAAIIEGERDQLIRFVDFLVRLLRKG